MAKTPKSERASSRLTEDSSAEGTAAAGQQPSTGGSKMLESRDLAGSTGPVVRKDTTPDTPARAEGSGFVRGRAMDTSVTRNANKEAPTEVDPQLGGEVAATDIYLPNQTLVAVEGGDEFTPPVNHPYGSEPLGLNTETGEIIMTPPKAPEDEAGEAALAGAPTPSKLQPQEELENA
jgi:hypothetical protein